jgi:hypothetical protein
MTIYTLYKKTHNKTGLQYLGYTKSKDPIKYKGSGTRWSNHINLHGYDVTTEILFQTEDKNNIKSLGIYYSNLWNIVESIDWANLKNEEGDGGYIAGSSWWNNGIVEVHTVYPPDETYTKGRIDFNNIGAKLGAAVNSQKNWVNNGYEEIMIFKTEPIPAGFKKGRLLLTAFNGYDRSTQKGFIWWNNGTESKMSHTCPGDGFVIGRYPEHKKKVWWNNGTQTKMSTTCPGDGFVLGRIKWAKSILQNKKKDQIL